MHRRKFMFVPLIVAGIAALLALAVFGLWNNVLVEVAGVKAITYWQALGLLVLARILVGGFPRPGGGRFGRGRRMMMEHWESLSPEQREKLRSGMEHRCCWGAPWRASPEKPAGSEATHT